MASISDVYSHANTRVDVPEHAVMYLFILDLHMIKNIGTTIILSPVYLLWFFLPVAIIYKPKMTEWP